MESLIIKNERMPNATTATQKATGIGKARVGVSRKKVKPRPATVDDMDEATVNAIVLLRHQVRVLCMSILRTRQHGASDADKHSWTVKADELWEKIDAFASEQRKIYIPSDIKFALGCVVKKYFGVTELPAADIAPCPIDGFERFMMRRILWIPV